MTPWTCIPRVRKITGLAVLVAGAAWAQTCTPSATATLIHAETLSEKTGDVVITCTGGTAGTSVAASIFVSYSNNITNRLDGNGLPTGITITVAGGTATPATLNSPTLLFTNIRYTIPTPSTTAATITFSGVRSGFTSVSGNVQLITAAVTLTGLQFPLQGFPFGVGLASQASLGATSLNNGLPCGGSGLPATQDFLGFAASSLSSSVRVTEVSTTTFAVKQAGDDNGLRLILRLSGYGTGVRLFVPDAIMGNNGTAPTATTAFSAQLAAGTYTPGFKQLLLSRVAGADSSGVGGSVVQGVPAAVTTFSGMTELTVSGGSAFAVYEVMDTDPAAREVAYLPVFLVYAQNNCSNASQTALGVTLGPVSTVATANATAPIPRFSAVTPVADCQILSDCSAAYYPRLIVDQTAINIAGVGLGAVQTFPLRIGNGGGAQLVFSTSVTYPAGQASGWLTVSPSSGINNVTLLLYADPVVLQPGTYGATVTVNAGAAGQAVIPVTFTVGPIGPTVQAVVNAASFVAGGVVPGSYAALFGLNLGGTDVGVTFNGLPATVVFKGSTQINLIVPPTLAASLGAANVVATLDGKQSNTYRQAIAPNALGIFTPGIVNADGSVNSSTQPAALGSTVAVYLTGLSVPPTGQVTVNIGSLTGLIPVFAGAQGSFPGLAQVNVQIPQAQAAGTLPLTICIPGLSGQPGCSNTVNLYTK